MVLVDFLRLLFEIVVYHKVIVYIFSVFHTYICTVRSYFIYCHKGYLFAIEAVNFVSHPAGIKDKKGTKPKQTSDHKGLNVHSVDRVKI